MKKPTVFLVFLAVGGLLGGCAGEVIVPVRNDGDSGVYVSPSFRPVVVQPTVVAAGPMGSDYLVDGEFSETMPVYVGAFPAFTFHQRYGPWCDCIMVVREEGGVWYDHAGEVVHRGHWAYARPSPRALHEYHGFVQQHRTEFHRQPPYGHPNGPVAGRPQHAQPQHPGQQQHLGQPQQRSGQQQHFGQQQRPVQQQHAGQPQQQRPMQQARPVMQQRPVQQQTHVPQQRQVQQARAAAPARAAPAPRAAAPAKKCTQKC